MDPPKFAPRPQVRPQVSYRPQAKGPHTNGRDFGLPNGNGPCGPSNIRLTAPFAPNGSVSNSIQVDLSPRPRPNFGPASGASVRWSTKPRARVYSRSDPCVGLPRVGDLHASDYSDSSGSHSNTTQFESTGGGNDSYIPMSIGTTSWYPNSDTSHHVFRDPLALHDSTPYSGTSSLLMGDGTPATISLVGSSVLATKSKLLHLSNVLCVPSIQKNLLSVSQFANDNDVFFDFHLTYCVVKDIVIREVLLNDHIREGLYHFLVPVVSASSTVASFAAHTMVQNKTDDCSIITLWHNRLGHPSASVVNDDKGYQCLLPNGKIVVSRHVVFDENRFLSSEHGLRDTVLASTTSVSTMVPIVRTVSSQFVELVTASPPMFDSLPADSFSPSSTNAGAALEPACPCVSNNEDSNSISSSLCSSLPVTNTHPMVTRATAGIYKPKALTIEAMEPSTIEEALFTTEWRAAAQVEYDALISNSTWELVALPPNHKVIGCKWLFKIKKNHDDTIARRKARLVAKGCSQVPGCDFNETFSPVVKPATIRVILSIAVSNGWLLQQVDVNNAFLNGDLDTEVFMQQPSGYVQYDSTGNPLVCRLKKALYGLRQAPRAWFEKLKCFLMSIGFALRLIL
ncbi:Reverse transcriptase, RNA-dependent DNA polymerase [Gossypium australe]|uniref:Reverse transcriptase, RNA-dependent DNA polymerase n=1 Tax=Gossypium australe TaxID=47621 RepID=A0A5B6V6C8_9ROSI|nr:Reverse transcriptase, RNA-dependent DNA polymerase [Gossypium australe]